MSLSIDEEILTWLRYWGITEHVEIEDEAKEMILLALSDEDAVSVTLDAEGGIIIESGYE